MHNLQQDSLPEIGRLKSAKNLKGKVTELFSPDEINEMAENYALPHYLLTNPVTNKHTYLFVQEEINDWIVKNLVKKNECRVTQELHILHFDYNQYKVDSTHNVPIALNAIKDLYYLPPTLRSTPPGVYFLCHEGEIVYIGQSINVASRIATHASERIKTFDAVYYIPCHANKLLIFEAALIRHFRPKYNGTGNGEMREADRLLIEKLLPSEIAA